MGYSRGYVPDYVNRCPICEELGFSNDQVDQIDQMGYTQCPKCKSRVTKNILYNYWDKMEEKQQKIDKRI